MADSSHSKKSKVSKQGQKSPSKQRSKRKANRFKIDVESMLVDGEEVIEQGVIHDGIYWGAVAVLIAALLVALFVVVQLGALLAVVAILMIVHATIKKEILLFVLTDKRIFVRNGILQVDVVDIRFSKIESIELQRMLPGYLMGYSNVVVMGTGNRYIVIPYVANGVQIRRAYNRMTLEDNEPQEVVVVKAED